MMPVTKSCDVPMSEQILLSSSSSVFSSISFSILSFNPEVEARFSFKPDVEGMFEGASAALISSNFSSN